MGALNTESNQTFAATSTSDYNGSSVHAPAPRPEKVDPFPLNIESNQTPCFPAATNNGNGLSAHSLTARSEKDDPFGPFIKSNQTPSVAATSNFDGLRAHSPSVGSEKVGPFSLHTESNQTSPSSTISNANGLSIHSPAAKSEKGDPFGLNSESNQTSSATATSKVNDLSIHSTAARPEKVDPVVLNKESNQPSSTAALSNVNGPSARSSTASSEKVIGSSSKFSSFSSSTSSPDSTLDDPFLEFDIEHEESTATITAVPKQGKQTPQASENGKNTSSDHHQIPISTLDPALTYQHTPKSSPGYVFESPQTQVMERCNNSKYRIPSSVFARNKSTAPDWSMASNESLFSIQMGGASFTRDHYSYFRSGELGLQGEPSTSGQKLNSSPNAQAGAGHWGKSQELSLGSVDNMKRVPSENTLEKSNAEGRISHYSVESNSSTKSFAFPVLTGDKDKMNSARIGSSVKLCPETPKTPHQPQLDDQRQPSLKPADPNPEPKTPKAASTAPRTRWFSCFPCCS